MREILFRGKEVDTGEWVEGWYQRYPFGRWPLKDAIVPAKMAEEGFCRHARVDPETVGQYTGLVDKNGKKIFEGDILRGYLDSALKRVGVVVFDDGRWEVHSQSGSYISELTEGYELEVIGNIHDNPELLKGE